MDDITREFIAESRENLDQLDRDLVALEKEPKSHATLANIFRTIHTLKGTCGFLSFAKLEAIAHAAENLLSLLRDGKLAMGAEIASALLATGDTIRTILTHIESNGGEGATDQTPLVTKLTRLQSGTPAGAITAIAETSSVPPDAAAAESTVRVSVALLDQLMNMVGELVLTRNQIVQSAAKLETQRSRALHNG